MTHCAYLTMLDAVDETFIADADAAPRRSLAKLVRRCAAVAAVVAVALAAVAVSPLFQKKERVIVTDPVPDVPYFSGQRAHGPLNGEVMMESCVIGTLDHYYAADDHVLFQVQIWLHCGGMSIFDRAACKAEAQSLADRGYEIYTRDVEWIGYWGETVKRTYICGLFTKAELEALEAPEDFGYYIEFQKDVDLDEYTLVE